MNLNHNDLLIIRMALADKINEYKKYIKIHKKINNDILAYEFEKNLKKAKKTYKKIKKIHKETKFF
jgi:hypothetical protein